MSGQIITINTIERYRKQNKLSMDQYAALLSIKRDTLQKLYNGTTKSISIGIQKIVADLITKQKEKERKVAFETSPDEELLLINLRRLPEEKRVEIWKSIFKSHLDKNPVFSK